MAGGENAAFLRNPVGYIQNRPINVMHFLAFAKATVERENNQGKTWLDNNKLNIQGTDPTNKIVQPGWNVIALDFVKRSATAREGDRVTFRAARLARSAFSSHLRFMRQGAYNFRHFKDTPNPIWGYFFPYVNPPGAGTDQHRNWDPCIDFGHVDFPRISPQFPFVFTGGFSGCALVITESPLGPHYYRAYHYPSPDTNPYQRQNLARWPLRVLHWFGFETYGGQEEDQYGRPLDNNAFIFLLYSPRDKQWVICSQLQHIRQPQPPGDARNQLWITEISQEQGPWTYPLATIPNVPPKRPPRRKISRVAPRRPARAPSIERKVPPLRKPPSRKY